MGSPVPFRAEAVGLIVTFSAVGGTGRIPARTAGSGTGRLGGGIGTLAGLRPAGRGWLAGAAAAAAAGMALGGIAGITCCWIVTGLEGTCAGIIIGTGCIGGDGRT